MESTRSLARDFSSSRRAPPKAASSSARASHNQYHAERGHRDHQPVPQGRGRQFAGQPCSHHASRKAPVKQLGEEHRIQAVTENMRQPSGGRKRQAE